MLSGVNEIYDCYNQLIHLARAKKERENILKTEEKKRKGREMSQDQIDSFIAITNAETADLAREFIEMAGGDLETAISLFFEHGGNKQLSGASTSNTGTGNTGFNSGNTEEDDAELARRLQREAYEAGEDNVRPPDQARHETLTETHVFPGTYGGIGGAFGALRRVDDMFDTSRPTGIFNQRISESESNIHYNDDDDDDDNHSNDDGYGSEDSDYEYVEEPVVELDEDGNINEYVKLVRKAKVFTKEEKLARLFRPPFDIMSRLTLDDAKLKARDKKKWILLNIQDVGNFRCQVLNRDLWSDRQLKKMIRQNFIFLQFQYESRNAEPYLNFYGKLDKESLPHIAILDPITGERLKQWNDTVPTPESFMEQLDEFLAQFSLDPKAANPVAKEPTPLLDPTTLTEEQQMKLAIKQSLGEYPEKISQLITEESESDHQEDQEGQDNEEEEEGEIDPFDSIEPVKHMEPPNKPGVTTRIQIRTGDGGRYVRRFNALEDTVRTIYEVIKTEMDGYATCKFVLSDHNRHNLIEHLDQTIGDAGLKNSSLLIEKIDD